MAHTSDQELELVYQAIVGIAAVCDGAVALDGQGFDGGDTGWGRGIASIPQANWAEDDFNEAARLLNKYSRQGEIVLGFDPRTLQIVQDQADADTHYASRNNARQARRRLAASAVINQRKARLLPNGKVAISWASKGDPDFEALRDAARALPNRRFEGNGKYWEADLSNEVMALIENFDLDADFEVAEVRERVAEVAKVEAERVHLTVEYRHVVLRSTKQEAFRTLTEGRWAGQSTKDIFKLTLGFRWNNPISDVWSLPEQRMNATVLEAAAACGFRVSDEVKALVAVSAQAEEEAQSLQTLLAQASRAKSLDELPAAFLAKVQEVLAR